MAWDSPMEMLDKGLDDVRSSRKAHVISWKVVTCGWFKASSFDTSCK